MGLLDLTISGNKGILDGLGALEAKVKLEAQMKLEEAGDFAKEYADEHAPVGSREYTRDGEEHPGYLKSQNYVEKQPGIVTVGNDAPYSVFVELGTHKMSAQPFLVPAMIAGGEHLKESLSGLL